MTNPNLTEVVALLDRSGSMTSIRDDTEGGFATFLASQREVPGECRISLYQFDTDFEPVYEGALVGAAPALRLVPRGATALLDAIARVINLTGARLAALPEDDRPSQVIVLIMTDGAENSSREVTRDQVFDLIRRQADEYSWTFVFMGANQDAIAEARSLGIPASHAITYAASPDGTRLMWEATSAGVSRARSASPAAAPFYTSQEREQAVAP